MTNPVSGKTEKFWKLVQILVLSMACYSLLYGIFFEDVDGYFSGLANRSSNILALFFFAMAYLFVLWSYFLTAPAAVVLTIVAGIKTGDRVFLVVNGLLSAACFARYVYVLFFSDIDF